MTQDCKNLTSGVENIGRRDVAWSYLATFFTIGAGIILLPFILHKLPSYTVGLWTVFQTVNMLVILLDFGFSPSFARNITYIFTGVRRLQTEGIDHNSLDNGVDYQLLADTISAMRKFYRQVALIMLIVLSAAGTPYFLHITNGYEGDFKDAVTAWVMLIAVNTYNLYTLYYDALLNGKGYVRRSKQITILGQAIYLIIAVALLYCGFGLTAIVSGQLVSYLIRRILSRLVFFTDELRNALPKPDSARTREVFRAIMPNAVKVGLTQLGGVAVNRASVIIAPLYVGLAEVASFGITMQIIEVLGGLGVVYYQSQTPKISQYRAQRDIRSVARCFWIAESLLLLTMVTGGIFFLLAGDWALALIHSKTQFLPPLMLTAMLVIAWLEKNHAVAAGFIQAKNEIPFFIPSLISGAATIILLWIMLSPLGMGLWGMILAPGLAQIAYQNWKWPSVVIREISAAKQTN